MSAQQLRAPFPYFGGKYRAASLVWDALGDPGGYVEPFAGSAAVLLGRPENSVRRVETINDADGWLINTWRAIQLSPDETAEACWGPVSEVDYHARLAYLQERRGPELISWLEGDPENHDPKLAAWWLYVVSCGIGDPWGGGPWRVVEGHLVNTSGTQGRESTGVNRELPHLGNAGRGIHRALPHLGNAGQGELAAYFRALQARLASVRITCGDWKRVLQPSVTRATAGNSVTGIFLDPPYTTSGDLYEHTSDGISAEVEEWCKTAPPEYRIVLAGYEHEHDGLLAHGWRVETGKAGRGAGYNTDSKAGRRERLWMSPACLNSTPALFELGGDAA